MMNLKIYYNSDFDEEAALFNEDTKDVILSGDCYHEKIGDKIQGFISALDYLHIEYSLLEPEYINHDNEMFDLFEFYNESDDSEEECADDECEDVSDNEIENTDRAHADNKDSQSNCLKYKNFDFILYDYEGSKRCFFGNIIEAVSKAIDIEGELYLLDKVIYSSFGLELEDNNKLLEPFRICVNRNNEVLDI